MKYVLATSARRLIRSIPLAKPCVGWFRHMRAMRRWRALGGENTILLELGSGAKKGENGWITVDIGGADINYDLRRGIPLRDCCVDGIYTSHMLEHIPYKELIEFISECKRVLKNGGYLSVCVPNAALYIEGYISKTNPLSESHTFYQPAVVETGSFLDQVNYIAYMDGHHHYLFDKENLVNTLKMGGFEKVVLRDFDSSLDLESRHFGSIYAIAYRQFEQR